MYARAPAPASTVDCAHRDADLDHIRGRRPTVSAAVTFQAAQVLTLQRLAGNAAVVALLGGHSIQRKRCGGACSCGGTCGVEQEGAEKEDVQIQRKCPSDGGPWKYEYDGCSLPALLVNELRLYRGEFDKDNPAGGKDTQFARYTPTAGGGGVACDRHDECYQSCGVVDRSVCDLRMYTDMLEICRKSTANKQVRTSCEEWAELYLVGLRKGAEGAFKDRQKEVCKCSKGSKTYAPALRYPPLEMLKNKRRQYFSWLEYTLQSGWLPLSPYKSFPNEQEYDRYIGQSIEPAPPEHQEGRSPLKMR